MTVFMGMASAWPSICSSANEACDSSSDTSPRFCPNSPSFLNPRVVFLDALTVPGLLTTVSSVWVEWCFFHAWKSCGMTTGKVLQMIAQTCSATVRIRKTVTPSGALHGLAHLLKARSKPSGVLQLGSVLSSVSTSRSTIRASSSRQALRAVTPMLAKLYNGSVFTLGDAYSNPTENIPARPSFFELDMCSLRMAVMGSSKIPRSEMRPKMRGIATCCTVVALHWP